MQAQSSTVHSQQLEAQLREEQSRHRIDTRELEGMQEGMIKQIEQLEHQLRSAQVRETERH